MQSGAARTPLNELMQTGSEVTASKAIRILDDDVSRVADSDDSKVADSAKCLSESVQLSQEMVGTGHTPVAPNAASTTHTHNASPNHTHNAFPNLTIATIACLSDQHCLQCTKCTVSQITSNCTYFDDISVCTPIPGCFPVDVSLF